MFAEWVYRPPTRSRHAEVFKALSKCILSVEVKTSSLNLNETEINRQLRFDRVYLLRLVLWFSHIEGPVTRFRVHYDESAGFPVLRNLHHLMQTGSGGAGKGDGARILIQALFALVYFTRLCRFMSSCSLAGMSLRVPCVYCDAGNMLSTLSSRQLAADTKPAIQF